jgi:NADPH-dependent curcumin reductase CurA
MNYSVPSTGREIHLASRPDGVATPENFAFVDAPVRAPEDGEVLVRNQFISVDPYMRNRMNDVKSYVPPFKVGQVMDGAAVGVVVESRSAELAVGDVVQHFFGWREYATAGAKVFREVDTSRVPASAYLGVLGTTGLTAYVGLWEIAPVRQGETVLVSGAAGAVGSVAGQLAKLRGAGRVIGSAGSAEKVDLLVSEFGFDAAFNYKDRPVAEQLKEAAPGGIDVYFDNVGGEHLEAAIGRLNNFGRIAACGAVAQYNTAEPVPGPRNIGLVVSKRLTMRGFIVTDHFDLAADFAREVGPAVADGRIVVRETVVEGIENAVDAFFGLLSGKNIGKMVVKVSD